MEHAIHISQLSTLRNMPFILIPPVSLEVSFMADKINLQEQERQSPRKLQLPVIFLQHFKA